MGLLEVPASLRPWMSAVSEVVRAVNAAARAYREGRTIVVPDVRDAPDYGRLRHLAPTQGYQALLASPCGGRASSPG
jgi:hypothetical protein